MRALKVSEDFVPVSEFKAQAADWLRRLGETQGALVVTQNGKPAAVVMSPAAFDALTERALFVSAVGEGLADADAGRVVRHAEATRRVKRRFPVKR